VIDYRVSYTISSSSTFTIFASGIMSKSAIVTGLVPGVTYKFVVQSRNVIGFSDRSDEVTVLAAQVPDEPLFLGNVAEVTDATTIGI